MVKVQHLNLFIGMVLVNPRYTKCDINIPPKLFILFRQDIIWTLKYLFFFFFKLDIWKLSVDSRGIRGAQVFYTVVQNWYAPLNWSLCDSNLMFLTWHVRWHGTSRIKLSILEFVFVSNTHSISYYLWFERTFSILK